MKLIYRIPCRLRTAEMRNAVRQTLKRIHQRSPADFNDLQSLVLESAPLSQDRRKDGTQGEWKEEQPKEDGPRTWGYGLDRTPGKLFSYRSTSTREKMLLRTLRMNLVTYARALRTYSGAANASTMNGQVNWQPTGMRAKSGALGKRLLGRDRIGPFFTTGRSSDTFFNSERATTKSRETSVFARLRDSMPKLALLGCRPYDAPTRSPPA